MQIELRNMFRRVRARIFAVCCARLEVNGEQEKKGRERKTRRRRKKRKREKGAVIRKLEKGSLREVSLSSPPFFLPFSIFTRLAFFHALDNDTPRPVMFHPIFHRVERNACFAA